MAKKLKIAFLHKALLYGGAERLILDMGLAFKDQGHQVTVYTAEFDPVRTFEEFTTSGIKVKVLTAHKESGRVHSCKDQRQISWVAKPYQDVLYFFILRLELHRI